MKIKIDKYTLTSDSNQFIVFETKKIKEGKQKGEDYDFNYSFHPTIASALNSIIKRRLRESDATTLIELKNDLNSIRNELWELFGEDINIENVKNGR